MNLLEEAVANIESEGKYHFGTLELGDVKVYERIPVHIMHLPPEAQAEHFAGTLKSLQRKLRAVLMGRKAPVIPLNARRQDA